VMKMEKHMNDVIFYRPYRIHGRLAPISLSYAILSFFVIGLCLPEAIGGALLFATFGIIALFITKLLYDSSNIAILLEQAGVRIIDGRGNAYRFFPWEGLQFAYHARDFKGNPYLVLSPVTLSKKTIRSFINKATNSARACVNDILVIAINLQDRSEVVETVERYIPNIVH